MSYLNGIYAKEVSHAVLRRFGAGNGLGAVAALLHPGATW